MRGWATSGSGGRVPSRAFLAKHTGRTDQKRGFGEDLICLLLTVYSMVTGNVDKVRPHSDGQAKSPYLNTKFHVALHDEKYWNKWHNINKIVPDSGIRTDLQSLYAVCRSAFAVLLKLIFSNHFGVTLSRNVLFASRLR